MWVGSQFGRGGGVPVIFHKVFRLCKVWCICFIFMDFLFAVFLGSLFFVNCVCFDLCTYLGFKCILMFGLQFKIGFP